MQKMLILIFMSTKESEKKDKCTDHQFAGFYLLHVYSALRTPQFLLNVHNQLIISPVLLWNHQFL